MIVSAALDYTYRYDFPSGVATPAGRPQLSLATCNADQQRPYFFDGRARHPRILGEMLYTLSDVVRTHFFLPRPAILDPVLTSNEERLRLEGFSGCCGVYARVDLPAEAFDGECHGRGTTNVDFNQPMRSALLRLRDEEDVRFAVGRDEVMLSKGDEKTIEKKVKLPLRWIKGFSEVQAYQPRLRLMMEASAAEALRFVRSLPKGAPPKTPSYAVSHGRSVRLSQRAQPGAVPILGTHRVKVIEPLLLRAQSLRVWCDEESGASGWEVRYPVGAFFLMISPEVFRGFSGEGQALATLAKPPADVVLAKVRASLTWQSQVDPDRLARELDLHSTEVEAALGVLGSRGLAGYDVDRRRYFHRELPFDLAKVEEMQPRLSDARKLIEGGMVRRLQDSRGDVAIFEVQGTGTIHRTRIAGEQQSCSCPWFSKYQGQRGPCKHILAASILVEDATAAG
ncbi:SWIM zinc finger family protein [Sphingomonas sp.]|uniref:SWIM zinc finger family protein n=1 Tax=Sphingomonas sp. TaxID=28214 RepID=UPI003B3ADBD3